MRQLLAGLAILFASCESKDSVNYASQSEPEVGYVQGIGYVEPAGEVRRLSFLYPGIVGAVLAEVGEEVSAGTVLMRQVARDEEASLAETEAALVTARAEYAQTVAGVDRQRIRASEAASEEAMANVINARRDFQRLDQLFATGAVSRQDRDHGETSALRAMAKFYQLEAESEHLRNFVRAEDIAVAESRVKLAQQRVESAKNRLADDELRAPIGGRVLEILHREGESSSGIVPEPMLIFADSGRLRVRSEIEESYALQLQPGQGAEIFGRGLGQERIGGKVVVVKRVMGKKSIFVKSSAERKDIDVIQVLIDLPDGVSLPVGFEVDVRISRSVQANPVFHTASDTVNLRK